MDRLRALSALPRRACRGDDVGVDRTASIGEKGRSIVDSAVIDQGRVDAFLGRALADLAAGYGGVLVSIGSRLGLYKAMAGAGRVGAREVAARAGCSERYVREWLNAQAAGGYVAYHAAEDRYELTPEQALVLADEQSPFYLPGAWQVPASMWADEEKAVHAFRTGAGVSWGDHDTRLHAGVAAFYANAYRTSLVSQWLPALDGVERRLEDGTVVADVGCGHGHSTILLAEAFPASSFHGFDGHPASIEAARRNAEAAGVAGRVRFDVSSAVDYPNRGYGLVCFFDALHDMGDPVAAARHARSTLTADGTVMLVEPFANDRVEDNLSPVARLYYAASTVLCCAHAISEGGELVLGAQAGEARLADVFRKAGFTRFRRAAETPFNLILEARP